MFDWLLPLLIVVLLLLKIFDMLDFVGTVLRLIWATMAGAARLATFLIRKLTGASKPQS